MRQPDDITRIVGIIREYRPDVQAIYLFGTHGTAHQRKDSDVDIALLLPPQSDTRPSDLVMGPMHTDLEEATGKAVDVIHLRKVDTVFQHQIIQTGRRIYSQDDATADSFEMHTMSLYQKLNEERAAILQDILQTGKVFD